MFCRFISTSYQAILRQNWYLNVQRRLRFPYAASMLLWKESRHLQITHLVSPEHLIIYYFVLLTTLNQLVILSFQTQMQLILLVDCQISVIQVTIYRLVLNLKSSRNKSLFQLLFGSQLFMFHFLSPLSIIKWDESKPLGSSAPWIMSYYHEINIVTAKGTKKQILWGYFVSREKFHRFDFLPAGEAFWRKDVVIFTKLAVSNFLLISDLYISLTLDNILCYA